MFKSLTNIIKDVAEVTVRPVVNTVETLTAPIAGAVKVANDMHSDFNKDARKVFDNDN